MAKINITTKHDVGDDLFVDVEHAEHIKYHDYKTKYCVERIWGINVGIEQGGKMSTTYLGKYNDPIKNGVAFSELPIKWHRVPDGDSPELEGKRVLFKTSDNGIVYGALKREKPSGRWYALFCDWWQPYVREYGVLIDNDKNGENGNGN